MNENQTDLRKLVIRAFHMNKVEWGDENSFQMSENRRGASISDKNTAGGTMTIGKPQLEKLVSKLKEKEPLIEKINLQIIPPGDHDRYTETIMDIIPISTKVLGKLGEGVSHTITGVYVILTGVDTNGKPTHEFGSSDGNLKEKLMLGRAGTPSDTDYIISFDVTLQAGMGQERKGPLAAHRACDEFIQGFRDQLKKMKSSQCSERHEYHDIVRPGKKKVLIMKQVAGQGAMYDTWLFPDEPSGVDGGKSIIDMGNMPLMVTPNEYRDGIIRSMQ